MVKTNTFSSNSTFNPTPHKLVYVKLYINKCCHKKAPFVLDFFFWV